MKKLILLISVAVLTIGCNKSTTTSDTKISSNTGDRVRKELKLTSAKDQTITRGATDKVDVKITRTNFDDPVNIELSGLPKGVEVVEKEMTIPSAATTLTFTLRAAADAAQGDHNVTITATTPGIAEKTTQSFKLTVK